jgi:hypothetical protein
MSGQFTDAHPATAILTPVRLATMAWLELTGIPVKEENRTNDPAAAITDTMAMT